VASSTSALRTVDGRTNGGGRSRMPLSDRGARRARQANQMGTDGAPLAAEHARIDEARPRPCSVA
jgi:hypothetical protein